MRSWGGEYAIAGQYDQLPVGREGGMFKLKWFREKVVEAPPGGVLVAGWDLAATSKAQNPRAAYTCRVLGKLVGGVVYILDVKRERIQDSEVLPYMHRITAADQIKYGSFVSVDFPQDPAASGKVQKKATIRHLSSIPTMGIYSTPETGSKVHRAIPVSAMAQVGLVKLVEAPWNEEYVAELGLFPRGTYMDQVDATSRMYGRMLYVQELDLPAPPIPVTAQQDLPQNDLTVTVDGREISPEGFSIQEIVAGLVSNAQDDSYASRRYDI
jgi:predicted phage terminase large subunit-like protein